MNKFNNDIRNKLLIRGFSNDTILNNRGLINAVIDETILLTVKKPERVKFILSYEDLKRLQKLDI